MSFDNGDRFSLDAEYLRVHSPSAEVQGHSPDERKTVPGKRNVAILEVQPVGNYAVRLVFDDLHSTGIFSWDYLSELGRNRERKWQDYLDELGRQGPLARSAEAALSPAKHVLLLHDHLGADPHPVVEIDHVVVGHPEAARRHGLADRLRLVRAVDAVKRRPRYMARAPSGLSTPPTMWRGRSGRRCSICGGGVQAGHSFFCVTVFTPFQVKPTRPTPMP